MNNVLTTLFPAMVPTIDETMQIMTSKGINGEITIDEKCKPNI